LSRLFTEVVQFDAGKLQGGGGSGFGLYLSKRIVDLHKGRLFASSEGLGKGCAFTLDLPLAKDEQATLHNQEEQSRPSRIWPIFRSARVAVDTDTQPAPVPTQNSRRVEGVELNRAVSPSTLRGSSSSPALSMMAPAANESTTTGLRSSTSSPALNMMASTLELVDLSSTTEIPSRASRSQSMRAGQIRMSLDDIQEEKIDDRLRVLVVDDADSNRKVLVRLLGRQYNVRQAVDGLIAFHVVKAAMETPDSFDVILMDNVMPNMDGPTAAQQLRSAGYNGVIIGITGNVFPEDIADYMAHGADQVLSKPVYLSTLKTAISECLSARRMREV